MASIEWDDIEQPKKGFGSGKKTGGAGGSGKFMRLEPNSTNRVRPVLKPIRFHKYFNRHDGTLRSAITEDEATCTVRAKYPELRAQKRYACLVFDRDDDNKLKILEGPATLFDHFKKFKKLAKQDPGSNNGGDFQIKVICPSGKKDRDTTYDVEFIETVPFTDEEKKFVLDNKESYDLDEIFKAQTPEEIERILFGDGQRGDSAAVAASSSTAEANDPFKF